MRRILAVVGAACALLACSDSGSPVVADEGEQSTVTTVTTVVATTTTTVPVQTINVTLAGDGGTAPATLTYDGDRMCLVIDGGDLGALTAATINFAGDDIAAVDLSAPDGCAVVGAEAGVVFETPADYELVVTTAEFPDLAATAPLG
jgi:hypothetical protein